MDYIYLETKQWWSRTTCDKFEQLSFLIVGEVLDYLPEEANYRMINCVTT